MQALTADSIARKFYVKNVRNRVVPKKIVTRWVWEFRESPPPHKFLLVSISIRLYFEKRSR